MAQDTKFNRSQSRNISASNDDLDDFSDSAHLESLSEIISLTAPSANGVRRRSSKACDQCRKSKCKCQPSGPGKACKNCILLGTACTFLGPSRKRGPPKGYIDAIEARLHQTEALLGILLSSSDARAVSLLSDMSKDSLAREIINRVNNSRYGVKGRKMDDSGKLRSGRQINMDFPLRDSFKPLDATVNLKSIHPSNDWQDQVKVMLDGLENRSRTPSDVSRAQTPSFHLSASRTQGHPSYENIEDLKDSDVSSSKRRQRRRISPEGLELHRYSYSQQPSPYFRPTPDVSPNYDDGGFTKAMGQLSLNEEEQVRYHGKASGLHLLGNKERLDSRNKGGIWRFPNARVWPPLPSDRFRSTQGEDEYASQLPDPATQKHLLDLYFRDVHPVLPVIHEGAFFDALKGNRDGSPSGSPRSTSAFSNCSRRRVPTLLVFSMFALSARYSDGLNSPRPADPSVMWDAGDDYLNAAKAILGEVYTASRPSTCQALLLMGYREIGIGAMAHAWAYIGMAIRMAQDLGMHRGADGWAREELGGRLFGDWDLHERKRIWYACVIMDRYVSTYIGRPLMICRHDFDTPLPSEYNLVEAETWERDANISNVSDLPSMVISCFNASATLSSLLGNIIQDLYSVRLVSHKYSDTKIFESMLDKWYIELPGHLQHDPVSSKNPIPPSHVLTLHMQYWCTVLLLHRPFIGHKSQNLKSQDDFSYDDPDDAEVTAITVRSHELCAGAANYITSIATTYAETYTLKHCSAFLCYYVFTASIMHVTSLSNHSDDPQARVGLDKCMDILHSMEVLWPSAGRALELLRGSKVSWADKEIMFSTSVRHKRSADSTFDDAVDHDGSSVVDVPQLEYPLHPGNKVPFNNQGNHSLADYQVPMFGDAASSQTEYPNSVAAYHPGEMDRYTFSGPLSTSVLPQLYSTGFEDNTSFNLSYYPHQPGQTRPQWTNRFPLNWNDNATSPHLGLISGNLNGHLSPHLTYSSLHARFSQ